MTTPSKPLGFLFCAVLTSNLDSDGERLVRYATFRCRVARLRALRHELKGMVDPTSHLQLSSLSGKLDLTSTATTKSPVILKFSLNGRMGHRRGRKNRKLKWAPGDPRHESHQTATQDVGLMSDASEAGSTTSGVGEAFQGDGGSVSGQYSRKRSQMFNSIPEEGSLVGSVTGDESHVAYEALDDDIDYGEVHGETSSITTVGVGHPGGGISPTLLGVRNRFRAALAQSRARNHAHGSNRGVRVKQNRAKHVISTHPSLDLSGLYVTSAVLEEEEEEEDNEPEEFMPPTSRQGTWLPGSLVRAQLQAPIPVPHISGSPSVQAVSPQFMTSLLHRSSNPLEGEEVSLRKILARTRPQQAKRTLEPPDPYQPAAVQINIRSSTSQELDRMTPRQSPLVSGKSK